MSDKLAKRNSDVPEAAPDVDEAKRAKRPESSGNERRAKKHKRAAGSDDDTTQGKASSPYGGWFDDFATRIEQAIGRMRKRYNFSSGEELELALCELLRDFLPERAAVTRGFIIPASGDAVGDDIIVYDAQRFPTFRSLRRKLEKKEEIPAEAVLAYVEVKHTLYIEASPAKKNAGQSISKALRQVAAVKAINRAPVARSEVLPNVHIPMRRRPGQPNIRNPWYAAIWALKVSPAAGADRTLLITDRLVEACFPPPISARYLPDVIAAGDLFTCPAQPISALAPGSVEPGNIPRPLHARGTRLVTTPGRQALALGIIHLSWAIEHLSLGQMPWAEMMIDHLKTETGTNPRGPHGLLGMDDEEDVALDYPIAEPARTDIANPETPSHPPKEAAAGSARDRKSSQPPKGEEESALEARGRKER